MTDNPDPAPPEDEAKRIAAQKRSRWIMVGIIAVLLFVIVASYISMRSAYSI